MAGRGLIGSLYASLSLDTAAFNKSVKATRSTLGRFSGVFKGVTAAAGALGTGILAAATKTANAAAAIRDQAQVANAGIEEFQKAAAAAQTVGVNAEQFADILKDSQEKIGEFISTGGGGMKDFFENIAPQVGLTAEALRDMSGPDALQAVFSALQEAGASTQEITAYMEAMASESSRLTPLLADNGAEMARLAAAAEGGIFTEKSVQAGVRFGEAMDGLRRAFTAVGNVLVETGVIDAITDVVTKMAEFIPQLTALGQEMAGESGIAQAMRDVGNAVVSIFRALDESGALALMGQLFGLFASGVAAVAEVLAVLIRLSGEGVGALVDFVAAAGAQVQQFIDHFGTMRTRVVDYVNEMIGKITSAFTGPLNTAVDLARNAASAIAGFFGQTEDDVTGNSYIPDMVDAIIGEMERLARTAVPQADALTSKIAGSFRTLATAATSSTTSIGDAFKSIGLDLLQMGIQGLVSGAGPFGAGITSALGLSSQGIVGTLSGMPAALAPGMHGPPLPPGFAGGLAAGGPVRAGATYLVGEQGPELFRSRVGGEIVPNDELGGGGGSVSVTQTYHVHGAREEIAAALARHTRELPRILRGQQMRAV